MIPLSILNLTLAATAVSAASPQIYATNTVTSDCPVSSVQAAANYTGFTYNKGTEIRLRISNGGAGQSGLVGALASAFIDWSIENGIATEDYVIAWVKGDTTDSINYLASGDADIAITYNAAAESRSLALGTSIRREYAFRDHFYLVGPNTNPADLSAGSDTVHDMFDKIVTAGNAADATNPTVFLSRYDKSATNIKESLLFAEIGQIPWAYAYSKWYHQYPQFPIAALTAASLLQEYTLTDKGTFLTLASQNHDLTDDLTVFAYGEDNDPNDPLLNPASALLGAKVCSENAKLASAFIDWLILPSGGGQDVVETFKQPGTDETLYTRAP